MQPCHLSDWFNMADVNAIFDQYHNGLLENAGEIEMLIEQRRVGVPVTHCLSMGTPLHYNRVETEH